MASMTAAAASTELPVEEVEVFEDNATPSWITEDPLLPADCAEAPGAASSTAVVAARAARPRQALFSLDK